MCIFDDTCEFFKCGYGCRCIDKATYEILKDAMGDVGFIVAGFIGHRCNYCWVKEEQEACEICGRSYELCYILHKFESYFYHNLNGTTLQETLCKQANRIIS
jgi:hypothetical protein